MQQNETTLKHAKTQTTLAKVSACMVKKMPKTRKKKSKHKKMRKNNKEKLRQPCLLL